MAKENERWVVEIAKVALRNGLLDATSGLIREVIGIENEQQSNSEIAAKLAEEAKKIGHEIRSSRRPKCNA